MTITYKVPSDFISQRDQRASEYNPRGRDTRRFLMDIDCELFEYYHIHELGGVYGEDPRWEVDLELDGKTYDCKNIGKYYNISQYKTCYLLRQLDVTDYLWFWEWVERPNRPLKSGDEVTMRDLATVPFRTALKNMQPSQFNQGYYIDVRKHFYEG